MRSNELANGTREHDDLATRVTRIIIRRRETWLMKISVGLDAAVCYRRNSSSGASAAYCETDARP